MQPFSIMNSCFIQYKTPLEKHVVVFQEINTFYQEWMVFYQFQMNLNIFEVKTVSLTVLDKNHMACISLEVYTYFISPTIIYCPI